jgi:hypothetical protein
MTSSTRKGRDRGLAQQRDSMASFASTSSRPFARFSFDYSRWAQRRLDR